MANRALFCVALIVLLLPACKTTARTDGDGVVRSAEGPAKPVPGTGLRLVLVARGLARPVEVAAAPGDDTRLFVVEQKGLIRIIKDGKLTSQPFLDVSAKATTLYPYSEQGLLGLAFHPDYANNKRFFIYYTDHDGNTVLSELRVSNSPDRADPETETPLFQTNQPYVNHNGGHITFGPDGKLYLGLGDGGSAGDPHGNGQNLGTPLGALLRFDVSKPGKATVPDDSPFVGREGALGEIWHYGLRNPWKFSFDPAGGDLYIADVGQNKWESVFVAPAGQKGSNFGWNIKEGFVCFRDPSCNSDGLTPPVLSYDHKVGCSITGGSVYRGKKIPAIEGHYFYSDYCQPWVRSFKLVDGKMTSHTDWTALFASARLKSVSTFGIDNAGELYIVGYRTGTIWRIEAAP